MEKQLYKNKYNVNTLRLNNWNYSSNGAYFLTLCTHKKIPVFGKINDSDMILNDYGEMVRNEWQKSEVIRKEIYLDEFVIMPNHLHGIVIIDNPVETHGRASLQKNEPASLQEQSKKLMRPKKSIGSFVACFKSATTKGINLMRNTHGTPLWQRNYYDHVIRSEQSLQAIREYIINNPMKWELDEYYQETSHEKNKTY